MEKKENKKWYVQPETEMIDVKVEGYLLSGTNNEVCGDFECGDDTDSCPTDDF